MAYSKEYYQQNKEKINKANRESYERNKPVRLQSGKKYREKNKDQYNEARREWYQKNKDRKKQTQRKWRLANKDVERRAFLKWKKENPDKWKAQYQRDRTAEKIRLAQMKELILSKYGSKCNCCGLEEIEFLTIDHIIYGRKNPHTKNEKRKCGHTFYRQVIKENFPDRFQILCMNCNWAKGIYGKCPHELNGRRKGKEVNPSQ